MVFVLLLVFYAGFQLSASWPFQSKVKKQEQGEVLLEKIDRVAKLITVEGHISEVYTYKDYVYFDILPLRKKAIIRVRARVSIGYDLSKFKIETQPHKKRVIITSSEEPEILSLEHELDYYDISEGTFNRFGDDDLNKLNRNAIEFIQEKVLASDLMAEARKQRNVWSEAIYYIAESSGWTVEFTEPGTDFTGKNSLNN